MLNQRLFVTGEILNNTTIMSDSENMDMPRLDEELTEEESKAETIQEFIEDALEGLFDDPEVDNAERAAEYFQMTEVMTMIQETREESLQVRREVYDEIVSRQHDEDFTSDEVDLLIDKFLQASWYWGFDAWTAIVNAINARIDEPQIQDTTLQTISYEKNDDEEEEPCCVCLDDFVENENLQKCPGCKKCTHEHCIQQCLKEKPTCPLCRHDLLRQPFDKLKYEVR